MIKNKKRLELNKLSEESPTLTNIRERNGIINPAFLPSPVSVDILPDNQHHNNNHNHQQLHYNQQNQNQPRNQYNPNWSNHVNQNGVDSQTSSWVYNFNQSYIPESATLPIHSRFKEYPENRYVKDDHLVYDVDLNEEHERRSKSFIKRKCCKTLLHLFVWCVIAVSLMGIAISVAFIVYVEKIAKCSGRSSSQIQVPNITIAHIGNSSSTTLSTFFINGGQNTTELPPLTTTLGVNITAIYLSDNITVSTLSPFNFNANQTSTSFPVLSNKSILIEDNNLTTTENRMSLEIGNSSSTTLPTFGINQGQNATELSPLITTLGVNITAIYLSDNITVATLLPFNFNANQTTTSFPVLSNKSILIEDNNRTAESHMSLEIGNISSTTLSTFGINRVQNATELPPLTTTLGVNITAIYLSDNITVSTLSPFNFNANQTSTSFPVLLNNSILIEDNNLTTTEGRMSLV